MADKEKIVKPSKSMMVDTTTGEGATIFPVKKTSNKKFYGYTGPVKPSGYIQKKSNKSYAKTDIESQKAYTNKYIKKKVNKKKDKKD
jgi:hypothetical protein